MNKLLSLFFNKGKSNSLTIISKKRIVSIKDEKRIPMWKSLDERGKYYMELFNSRNYI